MTVRPKLASIIMLDELQSQLDTLMDTLIGQPLDKPELKLAWEKVLAQQLQDLLLIIADDKD